MDMNKQTSARKLIQRESYISCLIFRLTSLGKQQVGFLVSEILKKHNVEYAYDDVFYIIMELAFNAIKANYRYVFSLEEYYRTLNEDLSKDKAKQKLISDQHQFETFFTSRDQRVLKDKINSVFSIENKAAQLIAKAKKEERELNEHEKDKLKRFLYFNHKAQKEGIEVHLGLSFDKDLIIIEVINDAPITYKALKKIYGKRMAFKSYLDRGEEEMFYVENLDSSESAGFGAAMIDARLSKFGLDPFTSFEVIRLGNKTAASVSIPIDSIRKSQEA